MTRTFRPWVLVCLAIILIPAIAGLVSAAPVPVITGLSPPSGPVAGGTVVTVTGRSFTSATDARFGGLSRTSLTVIDDTRLTVITPAYTAGSVPVTIVTADGVGGSENPSTMFRYEITLPNLTSIAPSSGSIAGGTIVTITGSGFTGTRDVQFGGQSGTSRYVVDDSHITVTTPPHTTGSVPISVINAVGVGGSLEPATMFRYIIPLPVLTGISPATGPVAGGTVVTITGSGFAGTKDVLFGGQSGTGLAIIDDSHITIITPKHTAGTVPVSITNAAGVGGSVGPSAMYQYHVSVPKLTGISPTSGSVDGGTVVTLTGSGFTTTMDVQFGGKSATGLTVVDDGHITVITPAFSPGTFPISITNAAGTGGSLGPATMFHFAFSPATTTTAMKTATPAPGSPEGGNASPAGSSPAPAAVPTTYAPGFEAVTGLSALGTLILLGKTRS